MVESKGNKIYSYLLIIIIAIFFLFNGNDGIYAQILEKNRPIAVMIGNSPQERKVQKGIDKANIVYEIEVEFPFTRLMALYLEDKQAIIGPIRSSRYYFSRVAIEWSAIFVHCGGQSFKNNQVLDIDEITYHIPFWRDDNIGGWINLFSDIAKLKKEISKNIYAEINENINHNLLNFQTSWTKNKNQINKITIKYNENYLISYNYNPEENNYYRYINNEPHVILESQENIKVANIIIQYVPIKKIEGDQLGRVEVQLIGEGEGKFFHSGIFQPIKWRKPSKNEQTVFFDREGTPITINKGVTWVHVLSTDKEIWFK